MEDVNASLKTRNCVNEALITTQKAVILNNNVQISELRKQMDIQTAEIKELGDNIKEKETQIEQLEGHVHSLTDQINEKDHQIKTLTDKIR